MPHEKAQLRSEIEKEQIDSENPLELDMDMNEQKFPIEIIIYNKESNERLFYFMTTIHGEIHMERIRLFPENLAEVDGFKLHNSTQVYQGAQFQFLSESLQKAFLDFLKSLGLDGELFYHIEYLAYNKEQRLYLEWLSNIYQFCKKYQ